MFFVLDFIVHYYNMFRPRSVTIFRQNVHKKNIFKVTTVYVNGSVESAI
jgi:hypothetical protein